MKSKHNIIILVLFLAFLVSCTKELTKDPIGLLTIDQVESDPSIVTIESSVNASYQPLGTTLNAIVSGWRWDLGTVFRTDVILHDIAAHDMIKKWNPDGDQAWMDELAVFSFTSENQGFNGIWVYDYEGINRINLAISYLTNSDVIEDSGLDPARRDQLLAESYFLRAFYYFDLVTNFGGVPLLLEPSQSFEEAFEVSVRVPEDEVREQIDLNLSEAKNLFTNAKFEGEPWRASKGAVISLQAKIALFNEDFPTVLGLIGELDGLDHYSLNPNYFDSFDNALEGQEYEVIFYYDHRSNETPNNNNGIRDVAGWGFWGVTQDFVDAFEVGDPRLLYTVDAENKRSSKLVGHRNEHIDNGNKVYIRYADVLLWKAEALNEGGDYPGAIGAINEIRERARTTYPADSSAVPGDILLDRPSSSDPSEIKSWIMDERRIELGFESQRYNDLKRWGIAKTYLNARGVNFQDHHYLYPIPQLDIDKSGGSITQNPGY